MTSRRRNPREDLRLLAEHHVSGIRYSRKGREIVAVRHIAFGWISPQTYYALQELHAAMPKILEGGYRLKEAIWSTSFEVEVVATGIKAPVAIALVAGALGLAAVDAAQGNKMLAILDILALALPYGEIYLLLRGAIGAADVVAGAAQATTDWVGAVGATLPKAIEDWLAAIPGAVTKAGGAVVDFFVALARLF